MPNGWHRTDQGKPLTRNFVCPLWASIIMQPYQSKVKKTLEQLRMQIEEYGTPRPAPSNAVCLRNLAIISNSVTQLSVWYSDIEVWCNQKCKGEWYWGWFTYTVENNDFTAHIYFDNMEDATLFKLSFPV